MPSCRLVQAAHTHTLSVSDSPARPHRHLAHVVTRYILNWLQFGSWTNSAPSAPVLCLLAAPAHVQAQQFLCIAVQRDERCVQSSVRPFSLLKRKLIQLVWSAPGWIVMCFHLTRCLSTTVGDFGPSYWTCCNTRLKILEVGKLGTRQRR